MTAAPEWLATAVRTGHRRYVRRAAGGLGGVVLATVVLVGAGVLARSAAMVPPHGTDTAAASTSTSTVLGSDSPPSPSPSPSPSEAIGPSTATMPSAGSSTTPVRSTDGDNPTGPVQNHTPAAATDLAISLNVRTGQREVTWNAGVGGGPVDHFEVYVDKAWAARVSATSQLRSVLPEVEGSHVYQVVAFGPDGGQANSDTVSWPKVPVVPAVTATVTGVAKNYSVVLTWPAAADEATSFEVTVDDGKTVALQAGATSAIAPGDHRRHDYSVVAITQGVRSKPGGLRDYPEAPGAPTGVQAVQPWPLDVEFGSFNVDVSWTESAGPLFGYDIFVDGSYVGSTDAGQTHFTYEVNGDDLRGDTVEVRANGPVETTASAPSTVTCGTAC